jgi:hypothetical protein
LVLESGGVEPTSPIEKKQDDFFADWDNPLAEAAKGFLLLFTTRYTYYGFILGKVVVSFFR